MSKLTKLVKAETDRIVIFQFMLILVFTGVFFPLKGILVGVSVAMGAFSYWFPTWIFMKRISIYAGARAAKHFITALFVGEVVKLVLCGMLFLVAIKHLQLLLSYTLIGLVGAIMAFWIASITVLFSD